ncbi:unnamed protein product, partial [Fusarium langsethiae]
GPNFTAQAPLLPVFFLGLLATRPAHKEVSKGWFEQVIDTPVRSSVPPLYEALERIWKWIDSDAKLQLKESVGEREAKPVHPGGREAWWEYLVKRAVEEADETLCLT